jgi:tripartite-type tricarboxylate transporter receptor subunit TctC
VALVHAIERQGGAKRMRTFLYRGLLALAALSQGLALSPQSAEAQTWPDRPVRIMVGAAPGGGTDIVARMLAEKFRAAFGQPFIVENRAGASTTIASSATAKATPDGYTLLVATNTGQAIAPHVLKLDYDPLQDLIPIAMVVLVPNVLVVNPQLPAATLQELVALAKANPNKLSYGSVGSGGTQHLAGRAFAAAFNLKMTHVPYKGSSQTLADVAAGHIQMSFENTTSAMGLIRSGHLRPLGVMSRARSSQLPDVPTFAEAGAPNLELTTWYALFATAKTPQAIVDRLHAQTRSLLREPDVLKQIATLGGEPGAMEPQDLTLFTKAEFDRFGQLVREAGLQAER